MSDIRKRNYPRSGIDELPPSRNSGQWSDSETLVPVVPSDITENSLNRNHTEERKKIGSAARKKKLKLVEQALLCDPVDVDQLREQAISKGGFLNDSVRRKVWPKLLQMDPYEISPKPTLSEIESFKEYQQVVLDVNRTLKRFPPGIPEEKRLALQDQLTNMIVRILIKNPEFHYYQGFHDICITFLLVAGEELGFSLMDHLAQSHLNSFLEKTMQSTVFLLNYVYAIVGKENQQLRSHMERADLGTIFCLSWVITWFSHVLGDFKNIVRLFDFFLAMPPIMPVYMSAAIVLHKEEDLMRQPCEMVALHTTLTDLSSDLPYEQLIQRSLRLLDLYPPEILTDEVQRITCPLPVAVRPKRWKLGGQLYRVISVMGTVLTLRGRWITVISLSTAVVLFLYYNRHGSLIFSNTRARLHDLSSRIDL